MDSLEKESIYNDSIKNDSTKKDDDVIEHYIWLQQALGYSSPKFTKLLDHFSSVEKIYRSKKIDFINTGFLSQKEIEKLSDKSLDKSVSIVTKCMEKGYNILPYTKFPKRLQNIYAPPCVLYTMGDFPEPTDGVYIAMVGSRGATHYGIEAATKLSEGLARCGAVVVSGLALGIDAASHRGALKGGGKTVAVIGNGLDIDYPKENRTLKRDIAANGCVVSEYPPETQPLGKYFPFRNRIIAGLSLGCVVVEAATKSGALITASQASDMGRDVFAVPGSIFSHLSDGTIKLIKDGAKPISNVIDILEEYIGICDDNIIEKMSRLARNPESRAPSQLTFEELSTERDTPKIESKKVLSEKKPLKEAQEKKRQIPQGLSETQLKVYNVMNETPMHVDNIALQANVELRCVLAALTTLEIEGYIRSFPGKQYAVI